MGNVKPEQLPLYAVTDCTWLGDRSLPDCVRAAAVSAIFAADDIAAATRELREVCDNTFGGKQ